MTRTSYYLVLESRIKSASISNSTIILTFHASRFTTMSLTLLQRLFGSGPFIHTTSLILFALTYLVQKWLNLPRLPIPSPLNYWIAAGVALIGGALASWIYLWILHVIGRELITTGPYKYVRHPIYAIILSFEWTAALFLLQSYLVIAACLISYLLSHQWIRYEEKLLRQEFGEAWDKYASSVGRFFPKF